MSTTKLEAKSNYIPGLSETLMLIGKAFFANRFLTCSNEILFNLTK